MSYRARQRLSAGPGLQGSSLSLNWMKGKLRLLRSVAQEAGLHLHSQASAGQASPYVSLRLVPEAKFPVWPRFRTRAQRRTLFPLFDETFDL